MTGKTAGLGGVGDLDNALPSGSFIETTCGDDLICSALAKIGHDCGDKAPGLADRPLGP